MERLIYLLVLLTVVVLGLLALVLSGRLVTSSASGQYRSYLPCVARQWDGATPTPTPSPSPSPPPPTPTPEPRWVWETVTPPAGKLDGVFDAWGDLVFIGMRQDDVHHSYRSEDRGLTWDEVDWSGTNGIVGWRFWFSPAFGKDGTVFGANSSLARSTDGGKTWARRDSGFSISYVTDVAFAPDYRYPNGSICLHTSRVDGHIHVYCSTNNGDWWERMIDYSPNRAFYFAGIEMLSDREGVLPVCHWVTPEGEPNHYEAELWRTEDGWATWTVVSEFPKDGCCLAHTSSHGLLAGSWARGYGETLASGIWQSLDGGRTWQLLPWQLEGCSLRVYGKNGLVVARLDKWNSDTAAWYELTDAGWRLIRGNEPDANVSFVIAGPDLVYFIHVYDWPDAIIQRGVRVQ